MFCSKDKKLACGEETLAKWDELSGSLRGRASVAYIDITTARETQARFGVPHNKLPELIYISRGKFYKYRFDRDAVNNITPILNLEALEQFVTDR